MNKKASGNRGFFYALSGFARRQAVDRKALFALADRGGRPSNGN